ncbi:MAG TPA: hypothetical protein VJ623_03280 [Holophagaceae bacterium]|nr:hypothetical protein [Holophagaceae bacterium]HJW31806.1 hypothetical protein [Holophagaceae bacterium]
MRSSLLIPLLLAFLATPGARAQAPLRILSVERRGVPPYEETTSRLYRLDGGENRGLHLGDRLQIRRLGEGYLGHLKVVEVRAEWAMAALEANALSYPLRGDMVIREDLPALPPLPAFPEGPPLPAPAPAKGSSPEAPPQEGLLWFLPTSRDLSPAGLAKLAGWVQAWGASGRWAVQLPEDARVAEAMQEARFEVLREALAKLGVQEVQRLGGTRIQAGANHPVWIQRRD